MQTQLSAALANADPTQRSDLRDAHDDEPALGYEAALPYLWADAAGCVMTSGAAGIPSEL